MIRQFSGYPVGSHSSKIIIIHAQNYYFRPLWISYVNLRHGKPSHFHYAPQTKGISASNGECSWLASATLYETVDTNLGYGLAAIWVEIRWLALRTGNLHPFLGVATTSCLALCFIPSHLLVQLYSYSFSAPISFVSVPELFHRVYFLIIEVLLFFP